MTRWREVFIILAVLALSWCDKDKITSYRAIESPFRMQKINLGKILFHNIYVIVIYNVRLLKF